MTTTTKHARKWLVTALAPVVAGTLFNVGLRPAMAQELNVGGGLTVVGQAISDKEWATNGTNDPDLNPDDTANGAGITYSVDLEFEAEFFDGVAFLYLIGAEGDPVYDGANADAEGGDFENQLVGVAEAWYAHGFFDDMFTVTLGKIDPTGIYDGNEVANDQTSQFLADSFVNNAAILFPPYTPGANAALELGDIVTLSLGMFEDDGATIAGEFQNVFFIGEMGLHYDLFDNPGNFRITGWNSEFNDRSGFAFNMDQAFADEFFSIFSRLGFITGAEETDPPETELAFSLGGQFVLFDVHRLGFAWNLDSPQDDSDAQSWFETYIDFQLDEGVNLAFDIQINTNPEYDSENDAIAVYGFRTQIGF